MYYVRTEFTTVEPLHITDDSKGISSETMTMNYIPGSSVRGALIGEYLNCHPDAVQTEIDRFLSDKFRFLNCYPEDNKKHELLPSIKGFYEDKRLVPRGTKKEVHSILIGKEVIPGEKRVSLGTFAYFSGDTIFYTGLAKSSDLKINIGKQGSKKTVFRKDYLLPGISFVSYVAAKDKTDAELIESLFKRKQQNDSLYIGNTRSSGFGKCRIRSVMTTEQMPYDSYANDEALSGETYLLLLSPTVMRNDFGEICGLNLPELERILQVENLRVETCSTSVQTIHGFNRKLGIKLPTVQMYAPGSLFRMSFNGTISEEAQRSLRQNGIGIRRNEGFGQVLFLKNYKALHNKCQMPENALELTENRSACSKLSKDDRQVLNIAARGIFQNQYRRCRAEYLADPENRLRSGAVTSSQVGNVRSIVSMYLSNPAKAMETLHTYFDHASEKDKTVKKQAKRNDRNELQADITERLRDDFIPAHVLKIKGNQILGINVKELYSQSEWEQMNLQLLLDIIDYQNREVK